MASTSQPSPLTGCLYDVLGVSPEASLNDIRAAFKKLALSEHPDKGGTAESFGKIKLAYQTLSNSQLRRIYDDTTGQRYCDGQSPAACSPYTYARGGVRVEFHGQRQSSPRTAFSKKLGPWYAGQRREGCELELTREIERRRTLLVDDPGDKGLLERVASAYLDRAQHHVEMKRISHALFDMQEAELLLRIYDVQSCAEIRLIALKEQLEHIEGTDTETDIDSE
jgi:curved DNA-binding protein CbpA